MNEQQLPSLYERLGGVYAIAAIVDDLLERRAAVAREKTQQTDAHAAARRPGLKYLVTEMLCEAAGGPQRYSGLSMIDSHVNLIITRADWADFMGHFRASLDRFGVAEREREEVFALVEKTRKDIITRP